MKKLLVLLSLMLAGSIAPAGEAAPPEAPDEAALLLQLDRDFDAASATNGAEAWVAYFGDHGAILQVGAPPISGPDAIRAAMTPVFTTPGSSLRWQPTRAEVLIPGALGYTLGRYQRRRNGDDGRPMLQHGTYFTLWRKQPDGPWKIAARAYHPVAPEPADEAAVLLQLDRDFDTASAKDGAEAWVAYFGDHGAILQPGAAPLSGPDAIRAAMAPVFTRRGSSLRWQPTRAEILIPGALGYTLGSYQRRRTGGDGRPMVQYGTYFTLWRKQPDGSWKIAADTGQPDGPFQPAQ